MNSNAADIIAPFDVEKVLREKNPRAAKWIPHFLIRYLKRVIHQDELNELIALHGQKKGIAFAEAVLDFFNIQLHVRGEENLPQGGRYIFVSNHPLGGLDGMAYLSCFGRRYVPFKLLVNDILMNVVNLKENFLPINKHGGQAREAARVIEEVYASDDQILVFPAGLVSRKQKGGIRDLEWKKNFINKAIRHKRDVIPLHISGRNSNFFYNLANLRKAFGIKSNFEMLYLPDEMFKFRNKTLTITIGAPIRYNTFDRSHRLEEWAALVKEQVYQLGVGE